MTEIYDCNHAVNSLILVVVSNRSVQKILVRNAKARKKTFVFISSKHCTCMPSAKNSTYNVQKIYVWQDYRNLPFICSRLHAAELQNIAIYM